MDPQSHASHEGGSVLWTATHENSVETTEPPPFHPFRKEAETLISRRFLPHWEQSGCTYFVTWRMADSLPAPKLAQLKQEQLLWIRNHPRPWDADAWKEYHRLFEGPVQSWLDKGYGSQFLRDSSARRIVATALHCFENQRYHLGDYVIMPNHAHVLLSPQPGCPLKKILHSWKSFTAKAIIKTCPGAPNPFWLMESYDHIVRSDRQLKHYQNYIRENPSKACLGANQWTHYEAVPPEIQEGDQSLPPAPISQPFSPED